MVYSWQDWSCYLEAVTRGLSSGENYGIFLAGLELLPRGSNTWPFVRTQGTCITLLVPLQNVFGSGECCRGE
jgi:hypothetical protein